MTLRVGLVGCGTVARRAHIPAWRARTDAVVAALCDPDPEAMAEMRRRFAIDCAEFATMDQMLHGGGINVVDICSPGHLHVDQSRLALEAGCHVLIEKPPAPSAHAAAQLAELALRRGLKVGVVLNYRFRDVIVRLKRALDAGVLGRIRKLHITHHGPFVFTDAPWLWDERRSKYLLWEFGIHFVDLLVYFLGPHRRLLNVLPTVSPAIHQTTDLEVTVEFENAAVGRLEITADTTRHSSVFTEIHAYGTGMDAFVRWFPPLMRLEAGQTTPLRLIRHEVGAAWSLGKDILLGRYLDRRNATHREVIAGFCCWLGEGGEWNLALERVLPTLQLLEEIEHYIPTYGESPIGTVASASLAGS